MQLFLCEWESRGEDLLILDADLLHQMRNVLRMRIGDRFCVQNMQSERYAVRLTDWDAKSLTATIVETYTFPGKVSSLSFVVAMPNRWDKAELIAQKLTELGVNSFSFWPSERSVIKKENPKKMQRIQKIVKEATEQSWAWRMPDVSFISDVSSFILSKDCIVFDVGENPPVSAISSHTDVVGIVGPEGGFTSNDYNNFSDCVVSGLGKNILRTETAAIVAARHLQHITGGLG